MLNLNKPRTAFLEEPGNREVHPLDYGVLSLHWLYWAWAEHNPHLAHLDPHFMEAVEVVILFFDGKTNLPGAEAADRLRHHLGFWRRDFNPPVHPLSQLGRVLQGHPGEFLAYPGPFFLLTFNEVLEGITHECVVPEWDLNDHRTAHFFIALAAVVLSEFAITCYWVLRTNGQHLDTALQRLFGPANREALVSQLGNLVLAGQVCGWGNHVDFIPEGDTPTPEWSVTNGARRVFVECASYERLSEQVNDDQRMRTAIRTAWNAKHVKFTGQTEPGVIATDVSGVFVNGEFGALVPSDHYRRLHVSTPTGAGLHLGVYVLPDDWELSQQEAQNRPMLGVIASALYSGDARRRNIQGFLAYQGQQIVVDMIHDVLRIPRRGFFVWRGERNDPELERILVSLHQPAATRTVLLGNVVPLSLFLV